MTIEKGGDWGAPAIDLEPTATAADDAQLAALAAEALERGSKLVASVATGDLLATLGISPASSRPQPHAYPMDLAMASIGSGADWSGSPMPFVAHLTAGEDRPTVRILGRLLGHGPGIELAVMNAAWLGELRLGPRAHPNDGLLDIVEGRVPFSQRREARRRARTGSHLPHPGLRTQRVAEWETRFDRPTAIRLDGVERGRAERLRVQVVPDALTVVA